jgi:NAD(P)-dependent dehydrogenase (short-subunit alcohol dehydrogenase family)
MNGGLPRHGRMAPGTSVRGRPRTIAAMELRDRVVVVTGGASGIGRALARRAHAEGARGVVVADLSPTAAEVAAELASSRPESAIACIADVGTAAGNDELVDAAEVAFGRIDVFFANAGVAVGTDPVETPDTDWDQAFAVNVRAHIHAARRLLPGWLARGEGYFCATASAAGLLTQIGSAPYTLTKHAAVAFAEWLSITYGDRGVRVSCLCPMGVNTPMLQGVDGMPNLGGDVVRAAGAVVEPDEVAEIVVQAVRDERFLILPHPEVHTFVLRKADDIDRWIAGMRRLRARVGGDG